jgi:4-hydroxy-3-methylbut-2-enyl diphosphate reductase
MKKIIVYDSEGFCFGVKKAIQTVNKAIEEGKENILIYGDIIHNKAVINDFEKRGVKTIHTVDEIIKGSTVIIRTHGIPPSEEQDIRSKAKEVIDTTCPLVKAAQRKVKKIVRGGGIAIIIGKKDHPEVIAEMGYGGSKAFVVSSVDDVNIESIKGEKIGIIAQTTFKEEKFKEISEFILKHSTNVKIYDTICPITRERQKDIVRLSKDCDLMIILGGKNSSNTRVLYEKAKEVQPETLYLENEKEFPVEVLKKVNTICLGTGTSTPPFAIKDFVSFLETKIGEREEVEIKWN